MKKSEEIGIRLTCATHQCKKFARWWYIGDFWCTKDYQRVKKLRKESKNV